MCSVSPILGPRAPGGGAQSLCTCTLVSPYDDAAGFCHWSARAQWRKPSFRRFTSQLSEKHQSFM